MFNNHTDIKKQFLSLLQQTGENISDKYIVILDVFFQSDKHYSAEEIITIISENGYQIGLDEVEDILNTFVRYGIARTLITDTGIIRYEHLHINEHHDHLICTKCKKIIELSSDELERFQERVTLDNNFFPFYHCLQIYGMCADCLGKRKPLLPLSYASIGERVKIEKIKGGRRLVTRLSDMGLYPGVEAKVLSTLGNYILHVGEMRLAIGRGMAGKIMVSPILNKKLLT